VITDQDGSQQFLRPSASADAVLFSVTDSPVIHALGLYREADYEDNGGHQEVTSTFTPMQSGREWAEGGVA
jgi:hypothetical protein